jgi:hypothetical protein
MTIRTARTTVTFGHPFALVGIAGLLPAGTYEIDTDEEMVDAMSLVAWRRIATTIHIRRDGASQAWPVDPVELDASLVRDAGLTASRQHVGLAGGQ